MENTYCPLPFCTIRYLNIHIHQDDVMDDRNLCFQRGLKLYVTACPFHMGSKVFQSQGVLQYGRILLMCDVHIKRAVFSPL